MLQLAFNTARFVSNSATTISAISALSTIPVANIIATGSLATQALYGTGSMSSAISTSIWNYFTTVPCIDAEYSPSEIQNIVSEMQKNASLLASKMYSYVEGSVAIDFYYDNKEVKANILFYPTMSFNGKKSILLSVSMMQKMSTGNVLNISQNGAVVSETNFEKYTQCTLKSFDEGHFQVNEFDSDFEDLLLESVDEATDSSANLLVEVVEEPEFESVSQTGTIFYSYGGLCDESRGSLKDTL